MKQTFNPATLPRPAGPYSQCVRKGNMIFIAGMVGVDADRTVAGVTVGEQTRQCLVNLQTCLSEAGSSLADVCTVTAYLEDVERDFADFNSAYKEFFPTEPPARATVQAHLRGDVIVELQAIALLDGR